MIFFTSDQHYYHKNVIKYSHRPFRTKNVLLRLKEWWTQTISQDSVEIMNEVLIKNHNSVVKSDDVVYHLGDFSLAKRGPESILPRLNGYHILIMGNHDWCHPIQGKSKQKKNEEFYLKSGFKEIYIDNKLVYNDRTYLLHHMPYATDEAGLRHGEWRLKDEGEWLLHGHVHNAWKIKGKQINVGVDVWNYFPVSIEDIGKFIEEEHDL